MADNGTGLSTLYNGNTGAIVPLVVTIPVPPGGVPPSTPTGTVFVGGLGFAGGAAFVFDTEDGTISAWSGGTSAVLKVNNAGSAIYKGLAVGQINSANFLYAANFFAGTIELFDKDFVPSTTYLQVPLPTQKFPLGLPLSTCKTSAETFLWPTLNRMKRKRTRLPEPGSASSTSLIQAATCCYV